LHRGYFSHRHVFADFQNGISDLKNYLYKQGFVLLELATVIAIIGVLAIMTLPSYTPYLKRAKVSEGISLMNNIQQAIVEYYAHTGNFPLDIKALSLQNSKLRGKYVTDIQVENGAIHLSFNDRTLAKSTPYLTFRPALLTENVDNTFMAWHCGYAEMPQNMHVFGQNKTNIKPLYLPPFCR